MKLRGLSSQIAWTMMFIAIVIIVIFMTGSYFFYYVMSIYWPKLLSTDYYSLPSAPEWGWFLFSTLVSLFIAVLIAIKLSQKILRPLNSVIDGINLLSKGHLSTRAIGCDKSLGEISTLTENFNSLAAHLEQMTEEQSFWNAAIAHELRTPVTILKGRLQGIADGVFTSDQYQLQSLMTQVDGLIRIIEDLRVMSLAESGHLDLKLQKIDISNEIISVVNLFREKFLPEKKEIIYNIQPIDVICDPHRIRQIIIALLDNCFKYSTPGMIHLETKMTDEHCILCVDDEGPGMSQEFLSHAFTAFRREKTSRQTGSGLGLAVVASIAKAHGGNASCHMNSYGGTCFKIVLPRKNHDCSDH